MGCCRLRRLGPVKIPVERRVPVLLSPASKPAAICYDGGTVRCCRTTASLHPKSFGPWSAPLQIDRRSSSCTRLVAPGFSSGRETSLVVGRSFLAHADVGLYFGAMSEVVPGWLLPTEAGRSHRRCTFPVATWAAETREIAPKTHGAQIDCAHDEKDRGACQD